MCHDHGPQAGHVPDLASKKCEGCQLKHPSFGLPAEGKKRWCGGCAKGHAAAVNVGKNCEDCQLKQPSFGLPGEGKKRWCGGCAKGHAGAVDVSSKKCEGCQLKQPSFGLPSDGKKRRWCGDCAPKAARGAGGRRTQAGGSAQKKPTVTDPPVAISDL